MDNATPVVLKVAPCPKSPPKYPDFCGRRRLQLEFQILSREIGFLEEELQSLEGLQPVSTCCKEVEEFVGSNPDPLIPIVKKGQQSCHIWKWLRSAFCLPISCLCSCCSCCRCCRCCCRRRSRCAICPSCSCFHSKFQCLRCAFNCPCRQSKCAACSPCSCFHCTLPAPPSCPHLPSFQCCPSCRRPPPRCCPAKPFCCRMPCPACALSWCLPWRWRWRCCCGCCQEASCPLPGLACPDYSCGCIWSCPKCTEARICSNCCSSKSSCVTGCLC